MDETFDVADEAGTDAVAARVARLLDQGGVVALTGDLGAGKTRFVRGLVGALGGDTRDVGSPTYVLHQTYPLRAGRVLHHLDAYRVAGAGDFEAIGFDELLDDAASGDVVAVEWPVRVASLVPVSAVRVEIAHAGGGGSRHISVTSGNVP